MSRGTYLPERGSANDGEVGRKKKSAVILSLKSRRRTDADAVSRPQSADNSSQLTSGYRTVTVQSVNTRERGGRGSIECERCGQLLTDDTWLDGNEKAHLAGLDVHDLPT